jgi:4-oxalomesaconate tautomerase
MMKHLLLSILIVGSLANCRTVKPSDAITQSDGVAKSSNAIAQKPDNAILATYMRGGTSKGPFFDKRDLPSNRTERDRILLKVMGSPDSKQIDGLGGTVTVTSKVVMAEPSKRKGIDVDYLFAQVDIENPIVDTLPPCGNMMAGVGPFAIEKGWVKATIPETRVMIYNINTKSTIEEIVQTPNGKVKYDGDVHIDGVPGTASPIILNLFNLVGGKTGKQFPTGQAKEKINDIDVTIIDAGQTMVLLKAADLGMKGDEKEAFFKENTALMAKLEAIRLEAGRRAGMGDVKDNVLPKIGILSAPQNPKHNIQGRYLTPKTLHPSFAVTGSIAVGTAIKVKGTVANEVGHENGQNRELVIIEHPSGVIEANIEMILKNGQLELEKAGSIRTVRKIMEGWVFH